MNGKRGEASAGAALVRGAVILGMAAVISKLLGTLQKIPLQNLAGDAAFGIYNAVYPLYILILFLATAGFPIAVSTFVSEQAARGNMAEARRILRIASGMLAATGAACFLLLFFGAGPLSRLIGNTQTEEAIRSVSFALLFVPLMAALRGYFQGLQDMVPTAVSQVVEQLARVATMLGLLVCFVRLGYPESRIAAGATFGSATGALAGLAVMLHYWMKHRKTAIASAAEDDPPSREPAGQLVKRFVLFALPVCLGSIVMPILNLVDTFTLPRLLRARGMTEIEAMSEFGLYNHGLPLVQLVSMLASSVSVALVPAIAGAKAMGDREVIRSRTETAIKLTWLIGLASSVGLALTAVPMNVMFFKDDAGSLTMAILAFTAASAMVNIVSAAILQGIGAVTVPARNLLAAAAVKLAGNAVLTPIWGINGAAVSAVCSFAVAALLNIVHIRRHTRASFSATDYVVKPGIAVLLMGIAVACTMRFGQAAAYAATDSVRAANTGLALVSAAAGAFVYGISLCIVRAVSEKELQYIPVAGKWMVPVMKRFMSKNKVTH